MTRIRQCKPVLGVVVAMAVAGPGESLSLAQSENVLIILADDLGVDVLECYAEGSTFPPTPTIDMLCASGVLFRNAWSNPVCSPTRATIQTGRYGFRTGVGGVVRKFSHEGLPFSETTIPEVLDLNPSLGYAHAAIGKWHLTSDPQGGDDGPNLSGYGHFAGTMYNLDDYFLWPKTVNGETAYTEVYATTDQVNEAIAWINDRGASPWFVYLAFNAPHGPAHWPPKELHSYDLDGPPSSLVKFQATVEAMDTEMGRLLASISEEVLERTTVIFLGDNGTGHIVVEPPFDPEHDKGTLYDGGINVPLIISGPQVVSPGSESSVLVNTTDLFATTLELLGVDVKASLPPGIVIDSRSVLPVLQGQRFDPRPFAYADFFRPMAGDDMGQAIRNTLGFKLIRFITHAEEFYDLANDPFEAMDLLLGDLDPIQQANFDALTLELDTLTASVCQGDANNDGTVDPLDTGFVLARFGCSVGTGDPTCDVADQNGDGAVDPLDSGFVLARFGECP
ncbi:MAG: sulfatase-like hydrolase/transferase [Planctomycetes bacterium]|nr:sulfatase-like hydrolase/transferase [Planctomycetota bacterium]